jgi:hypothetical protein
MHVIIIIIIVVVSKAHKLAELQVKHILTTSGSPSYDALCAGGIHQITAASLQCYYTAYSALELAQTRSAYVPR